MKSLKNNSLIVLVAVLVFSVCAGFFVSGGNVIVRGGSLNVSDNFWAGGSTLYVDYLLGRVGIGTTSPVYKLDVNGSLRVLNSSGGSVLLVNSSDGLVTVSGDFIAGCPSDMVKVGSFCIDKYEASVWTGVGGTGTQVGNGSDAYDTLCGGTDSATNFSCYASSAYNVTPSSYITWFQAQVACTNAGKQLCTNAQWQAAAMRTPDNASCTISYVSNNVADDLPAGAVAGNCYDYGNNDQSCSKTGTAAGCKTPAGVYDMVGNVWEWVSDWSTHPGYNGDPSTFSSTYGSDVYYHGGPTDALNENYTIGNSTRPYAPGMTGNGDTKGEETSYAAFFRGGAWGDGADAGVFALRVGYAPSHSGASLGFRCCK